MIAYFIAYAGVLTAISVAASRRLRGPDDFLMGGRGFGSAAGIGLLGGIFVAGTAVGVVGQGYAMGWAGAGLDLALGLGFAILLFTLLGRVRGAGHASVSELLGRSYGLVAGRLSAVVAGGCWAIVLAAFMAAAGRALSGLLGWSQPVSIGATAGVLLLFALPGGMRAVVVSNLIQLVALLLVLVWVAVAAEARAPIHAPPVEQGFPASYLAGLTLLSTPTTVVAPDVLLGVASLRDDATARATVALVAALLAVGGLFLAYLGTRASGLVDVREAEQVLPALIDFVLPAPVAAVGLVVLFGSSVAGAVSELMVCAFLLDEARSKRGGERSLVAVRTQLAGVAVLSALLAMVNPFVVDMVLIAFRLFVPAVVPQAVAALVGYRPRAGFVIASMVVGPLVAITAAVLAPETTLTALDPVLWGSLVAIGLLAAGARARTPANGALLHEN